MLPLLSLLVACTETPDDTKDTSTDDPGADTATDTFDSTPDTGDATDTADTADTVDDLGPNTFRFMYKGATGTVACAEAYDTRFFYDRSDDYYGVECNVAADGAGTGAYATTAHFGVYGRTVRAMTAEDFGTSTKLSILRPSGTTTGAFTTQSSSDYTATEWTVSDSAFTGVDASVPQLAATVHMTLTDVQGETWTVDMNLDSSAFEARE